LLAAFLDADLLEIVLHSDRSFELGYQATRFEFGVGFLTSKPARVWAHESGRPVAPARGATVPLRCRAVLAAGRDSSATPELNRTEPELAVRVLVVQVSRVALEI
jgi:hypothetical protein